MTEPLLAVSNLSVAFDTPAGAVTVVDDVSFSIRGGETLGLVGESGSGKSITAFSIVRLLPARARVMSGRILFQGKNLLELPDEELRALRGAGIGFVFQEPMAALNPIMRVGAQIAESLIVHGQANKRGARDRAVELLRAVRIRDAEKRVDDYPHQLSGGMQQRVMLAVALACHPPLLIADEPTTALDVTVQAEILELLRALKQQFSLSILLITHDLGVIADTADHVAVMRRGKILERGPVRQILQSPQHAYTQQLLNAIPGTRTARA